MFSHTSWENMKGANALSLNAGMSLLQCEGHDIGGFEGCGVAKSSSRSAAGQNEGTQLGFHVSQGVVGGFTQPKLRPFVLTRSATAGTLRYAASSWSGDNVTSWENMKGANALSLNAGMSLLQP
jgi:alpha-glucosidase (family GH31 glycosyl hydrolase)